MIYVRTLLIAIAMCVLAALGTALFVVAMTLPNGIYFLIGVLFLVTAYKLAKDW